MESAGRSTAGWAFWMFDVENRDERCGRLQGDSRAPQRAGRLVTCALRCELAGQGFHRLSKEILPFVVLGTTNNKDILVLLGHGWVDREIGPDG